MKVGEAVHITPKTVHRMTAIDDCDIFEVSTPELHDVVRLEDRYGRTDVDRSARMPRRGSRRRATQSGSCGVCASDRERIARIARSAREISN